MTTAYTETTLVQEELTKAENIREDFTTRFSRQAQYLSGIFFKPIFHLFFKVDIRGLENILNAKKPLLIISNHASFYDSFLFRLIAPYELLPLRFMAVETFIWPFLNFLKIIGIINFVYSLFGVFVVVPGRGLKANLVEATQIIRDGGVVVVYPEGEIFPNGTVGDFKKGAAVLAQKVKVSILPVSFRVGKSGLFRRRISINIGAVFSLPNIISDVKSTDLVRGYVVKLFNS